jgi:hypothetical protein
MGTWVKWGILKNLIFLELNDKTGLVIFSLISKIFVASFSFVILF